MDIKRFLKLLKKYILILIVVPLLAGGITYYLCQNLPKVYESTVQISTGIVDKSKQLTSDTQTDYYKSSLQFSNIIEKLKMRKIMSILSYNLIIHDLQNPKAPFRKYSPKLDSLSETDRALVLNAYQQKLLKKEAITIFDNKGKYPLYDILASMKYDESRINKKLSVYRPDNSDFINIEYTSENPMLSAYLVNTLASEFINNYSSEVYANQNNSIVLLDSLLKNKEQLMNEKNNALKAFKTKNGVLNLSEQASTVYSQISQYEEKKAQAIQSILANQGALAAINSKLRNQGGNSDVNNTVIEDNGTLLRLRSQLQAANNRYIDGNFKASDKRIMDSLQNLITIQTQRNSDNNVIDPVVAKQGLATQKSALEISTEQIKNTINSIDQQLATLKSQYNTMVPFDAGIQNYERDADIATKDYMAALDRTNQGRTEQSNGLRLSIAQIGLPGSAEPSKNVLYAVLAGGASFLVCFSSLILLFLIDRSIHTSDQLIAETGVPVLGSLNLISGSDITIRKVWNDETDNNSYNIYKDLLRSSRFEISNAMSFDDSRVLGITSLTHGEGKTFVANSLAYAFAMTGRKVLLIADDENAVQSLSDSKQLTTSQNFENFLVSREIKVEDLITRLNKVRDNVSLLELQNERSLRGGFDVLRKEFDIIIIDVNSLLNINLAKEWLSFTEKNLAVFEAGKSLSQEDKSLIAFLKTQPNFMGFLINKVKLSAIKS